MLSYFIGNIMNDILFRFGILDDFMLDGLVVRKADFESAVH